MKILKMFLNVCALVSLSTALLLPTARAQTPNRTQPFPADLAQAPKARIQPDVLPMIKLNGYSARLTAGARIYGPDNLLVLPANIPAGALVRYQLDQNGDVKIVWILTEEEARQR
ncbi:MAG: hypothetical protein K1X48_09825 [Burkholderiaceae bacterium]|nr:hypothetical protein [Burkholderiaceae bacterium]